MARAEILDGLGRSDEAHGEYERARRLWSELPPGAADRRYVYRRQGYFAFEAESYDLVRTNVRSKILPQIAHGNAVPRPWLCGRGAGQLRARAEGERQASPRCWR
jgi:hypothetical protein